MRAIAEEAFAMVRDYKGSHSGEHGDGIVRSEFHEPMFGSRLVRAFEEVKDRFDPNGPVQSRQDRARAEIRRPQSSSATRPAITARRSTTQLDWSAYPGAGGGFQGAVEMCNNNGACRKLAGGVMCPSYRVTRDERDVTRGRANTLRLAITGQLGPDALTSDEMAETLKLCVSCKACRRECPTGVDMARMKIEVQAARAAQARVCRCTTGWSAICRAMRPMPRAGPWLLNLRDAQPGLRRAVGADRRLLGAAQPAEMARGYLSGPLRLALSPRRRRRRCATSCCSPTPSTAISSARISTPRSRVLVAGGYRVHAAQPARRR